MEYALMLQMQCCDWFVLCVCLSEGQRSRLWVLQKQLNQSRCRLGIELGGLKEQCIRWGADPRGEGAMLGVICPIEKHWEVLLWCTQKWLNRSSSHLEG